MATLAFVSGILGLFVLDRDKTRTVSPAIWIPVVWVSLAASRALSQWLQLGAAIDTPDQLLDGNPVDRLLRLGLLMLGLLVLLRRGTRVTSFLSANWPIVLLFLYMAVSVLWAEYPEVGFKRWTKAAGDIVMLAVVLTDPNPSAAVKQLLARIGFLLIPASILLIKYFPSLAWTYDRWTGAESYTGVATSKNSLGFICLVFGLGSLWRVWGALGSDARRSGKGSLLAHGVILIMTLWLFSVVDSATSLICFLLAGTLIAATSLRAMARNPAAVHLLAGSIVLASCFIVFLGLDADLIGTVGRNSSLTGRTDLWNDVLRVRADLWFGTGFESFWIGDRLQTLWTWYPWRPNQSHNGYLEIFLNLGVAGLLLIVFLMVWGYRNIVNLFSLDPDAARLKLAYFAVAVFYNFTEAAFKMMHPVWFAFLLAIAIVPNTPEAEEQ